jgi:hypothetical protein
VPAPPWLPLSQAAARRPEASWNYASCPLSSCTDREFLCSSVKNRWGINTRYEICVLGEGEGVVAAVHGGLGQLRDGLEVRREHGSIVGVGVDRAVARRRGDVHELRVREEEAGEVAGRRHLEPEHRLRRHHAPVLVRLPRVPLEHRRRDPVGVDDLAVGRRRRRRVPVHLLRRGRRVPLLFRHLLRVNV